jgi:cysteine desulfurase
MIYLDHNATSSLRPDAKAAMRAALEAGGNPSSVHGAGRKARARVAAAREQVAALAGVAPAEMVFTSGGTEAIWLALNGAAQGAREADARITRLFVSAIEHDAVRANAVALAERVAGLRVETLPVTRQGIVDLDALKTSLREGKGRALVAIMAANNETGVIQPVEAVSALAKEAGALLLVDAVQAAGKIDLHGIAAAADYMALSAHKLGGPQGVGALVARGGAPFAAQILGGGQEKRRRAGTENVAGIAGFGAAAAAAANVGESGIRLSALRDRFEHDLKCIVPDAVIFGADAPRLANTSNFALPGLAAETAVMALDLEGVMVSSGAACASGKVARSHVLAAMGVEDALARSALRVSFGWTSRADDGAAAIAALTKLIARARARAAA